MERMRPPHHPTPVRATAAGAGWVTVGSLVANVAGYLLHLPASRWLGPDGYGSFASLLSVQLVLAVPALAVQAVVAREVVRGRAVGELRRSARDTALTLALLSVLLAPVAAAALHTSVVGAAAAALTAPLLVVLSAELGVLQGRAEFRPLAGALAATALLRVAPAVAVLAAGAGATAALLAGAVGTLVAAVGVRRLAGPAEPVAAAVTGTRWRALVGVARASQVQLVLIVLTSVDLLAARALLGDDASGLYALGAVAAKAAFWLPQAVGVVLYPQLADPSRRGRALRTAVLVLLGVGAVVVLGAAVAAPVVPVLVGPAYAPITGLLWLFALQGAALTVLQSALLAGVARDRTRVAALAWAGLVVEVAVLALRHGSVTQVLVVAAVVAVVLAALTTGRELTRSPG
jgi:O-antigen/teichoic acid export membrane protein